MPASSSFRSRSLSRRSSNSASSNPISHCLAYLLTHLPNHTHSNSVLRPHVPPPPKLKSPPLPNIFIDIPPLSSITSSASERVPPPSSSSNRMSVTIGPSSRRSSLHVPQLTSHPAPKIPNRLTISGALSASSVGSNTHSPQNPVFSHYSDIESSIMDASWAQNTFAAHANAVLNPQLCDNPPVSNSFYSISSRRWNDSDHSTSRRSSTNIPTFRDSAINVSADSSSCYSSNGVLYTANQAIPPLILNAPHSTSSPSLYGYPSVPTLPKHIFGSPHPESAASGMKWAASWHCGWKTTRAFAQAVLSRIGCSRATVERMYPLIRATRLSPQHLVALTILAARFLMSVQSKCPSVSEYPYFPSSAISTGHCDSSHSSVHSSNRGSQTGSSPSHLKRSNGAMESLKVKISQATRRLTRSTSRRTKRKSSSRNESPAFSDSEGGSISNACSDPFIDAWCTLSTDRLYFDPPVLSSHQFSSSKISSEERCTRIQIRILTACILVTCKVLNDHSFTAKAIASVAPAACFSGIRDLVKAEKRVIEGLAFDLSVSRAHIRLLLASTISSLRDTHLPDTGVSEEEMISALSACRRYVRLLDETIHDLSHPAELSIQAPCLPQVPAAGSSSVKNAHRAMDPSLSITKIHSQFSITLPPLPITRQSSSISLC